MKKVMLITGASSGIGAAVASKAVAQGYAVAINYHSQADKAQILSEQLQAQGAEVICLQADVSCEEAVVSLFEQVQAQLGTLTALVNNAGVIAPLVSIEAITAQRLHQLFDVNVIGSFLCAREAVKRMSQKHGGHGGAIVNISSIAARLGSPHEFIDYAASKAAVDTLTLGLAKEVADQGIRVNAVRPGLIDTPLHAHTGDAKRAERLQSFIPMQRVGQADEVANAVLWLLSDEASYVTGTLLDVSGGR